MWLSYFVAFFVSLIVLFLPGFLIVSSLQGNRIKAICVSPIVGCGLYTVAGVLLAWFGLYPPILVFFLVAVLISAIINVLIRIFFPDDCVCERSRVSKSEVALVVLSVSVSLAVFLCFYVKGLNGADSVMQQNDNTWHLGVIAHMLESGNMSILAVSDRYASGGFYPAAWHIVCAIAASVVGTSAAIAENAVNFALCGVVFPAAAFYMLKALLPGDKASVYAFPVCAVASTAFPLGLFLFGPLYPNLAGMCCLPAFITLFVDLLESPGAQRRGLAFLLFLLSAIGLAALHPNALFLAAIVLAPYCCVFVHRKASASMPGHRWLPFCLAALFALLCVGAWSALFALPAFKATVSYYWPSITSPGQAFLDVVTLSLRNGVPQIALALLVYLGIARCLILKKDRWVIFPFGFTCVQYFVCASTDGFWDSYLTGFWYTDQWRIAANVAFTAIPLSCIGLAFLGQIVLRAVHVLGKGINVRRQASIGSGFCVFGALLVAALIYCPSYSFQTGSWDTAYGYAGSRIGELNSGCSSTYTTYTNAERAFAQKAKAITGDDLVFNCKPDGGYFAYLQDGLNAYYRTYSDKGPGTTAQEEILRTRLNEYSSNSAVQNAVSSLGVKYLLKLDIGESYVDQGDYQWSINGSYYKSDWEGVESIDDKTEGFEVVLAEGDLRLYRIIE